MTDVEDMSNHCIPKSHMKSYLPLNNNFLRQLDYYSHKYGLDGACVPETLHVLLLGYYPYLINNIGNINILSKDAQANIVSATPMYSRNWNALSLSKEDQID